MRSFHKVKCGNDLIKPKRTCHLMLSQMYRAHDLLTNCLQQSTITLAILFEPELDGTSLFNNSDLRYRQSLQLCEDLAALFQLDTCGNTLDESSLANLSAGLKKFRNESLECLMYSDWPQFESFSERINLAGNSGARSRSGDSSVSVLSRNSVESGKDESGSG